MRPAPISPMRGASRYHDSAANGGVAEILSLRRRAADRRGCPDTVADSSPVRNNTAGDRLHEAAKADQRVLTRPVAANRARVQFGT